MAICLSPTDLRMGRLGITADASPFNVPRSITAEYNPSSKMLDLHFRYISQEPVRSVSAGEESRIYVGRNSSRVYGISLNTNRIDDPSHLLFTLLSSLAGGSSALDRSTPFRAIPHDNYCAVRTLLENSSATLTGYVKRACSSKGE